MDEIDRAILNEIQSHFPIEKRPYKVLAERLNLKEKEVIERVKRLYERGIIRRIGGNFHSHILNFKSTLCAAKVPKGKIDEFVRVVNSFPGVTHNYLRNHEYNIWFTFIAPSLEQIEKSLRYISEKTGIKDILNLPAVKMYKIKVDFEL